MGNIDPYLYLGLPQGGSEGLANGTFEDVTGDDFADWTETEQAGSEMISNGDFESVAGNNFGNWNEMEDGTGTVVDEGVEVHGGSHSAKLTKGNGYARLRQGFTAVKGKSYRATVWVKGAYKIYVKKLGLGWGPDGWKAPA